MPLACERGCSNTTEKENGPESLDAFALMRILIIDINASFLLNNSLYVTKKHKQSVISKLGLCLGHAC